MRSLLILPLMALTAIAAIVLIFLFIAREALPMLAELEQHEAPYLTGGAKLPAFEGAPSSAAGSPQWPRVAFVGGVLAALLGLVLMAIGWPRLR